MNDSSRDEFITIARVAKTQGRHGEVAADLHTDFPEKFSERRRLFALQKDGSRTEMRVERHWPHKGWMVLKFAGIDSIDDAERLKGCELQIPFAERAQPDAGATFVSDLVGCKVFDGTSEVGTVKDVDFTSGAAPVLVVCSGNIEHLVPFAETFLRRLDVAAKRIEMQLPEGLLALSRPLTEEEIKRKQREK